MNGIDLYEVLGAQRTATPQELHTAYRGRAKKVHPDAGGSQDAFEALRLAYSVLSDPERRERYDRTGEFETTGADNTNAFGLEVISQVLAQYLDNEHDPACVELQKEMTAYIEGMRQEAEKVKLRAERAKRRAEKLIGRFKTKDGGEPTPVEVILHHAIARQERAIGQHANAAASLEAALELLKHWTFDREIVRPDPFAQSAASIQFRIGGMSR